ncbi:unnamed protein product [Calypogeia fissa]
MRSSMVRVSSPTVSFCSIRACHICQGRWDSWSFSGSMGWLNFQQPCRSLPKQNNSMQLVQDWRSRGTVALAAAPVRWNLDDVERISRGRPSKAKTGSRAVPHRLNAEERKDAAPPYPPGEMVLEDRIIGSCCNLAFELAKKRGYVTQQANSRRYPLINTYRNYCDALDFLCIRIEQGTTGFTDQVVIDFTPLHLSTADLSTLRAEISKAVMSVLAMDNDQTEPLEVSKVDEEGLHTTGQDDSSQSDNGEESAIPDLSTEDQSETLLPDGVEGGSETLRFSAPSRNMTKAISQIALDTWKTFSRNKGRN